MPTFTGRVVSVTPQLVRTDLALTDIRALLAAAGPSQPTRTSGWRSTNDEASNLGVRDGVPPAQAPEILAPSHDFPTRLAARYYYWRWVQPEPRNVPGQYLLDAVDLFLSESGTGSYLALWSSHDADLIDPTTGDATQALLSVILANDSGATVSDQSPLRLMNPDVFLWLAQQMESQTDIGSHVLVRGVSSIDADERKRSRSATLRGDVDMERVAFLSAIAERSTLGPAVVTLSQPNSEGRVERLVARIWVDGSYQLAITPTYLSKMPLKADQRLESTQRFGYRYIPLIKAVFEADTDWASNGRDWLVIEKQVALSSHYRALAEAHPRWAEYQLGNG